MAKQVWTFAVRDRSHTVELEHVYWSGRAIITVDGEEIERSKKIGQGSMHEFQVSGVPCILEIIETGLRFRYELFVDGEHVYGQKEGEKASQVRRIRNGLGALHIYFNAMLYSYLLFFVLVPVVTIALGISSVIGQNNPPEEGIWWFPFIAGFLALLSYGALYYFTRRAKLWGIYRDVFSSRTEMSGRVGRKWVKTAFTGSGWASIHFIEVGGRSFEVFGRL